MQDIVLWIVLIALFSLLSAGAAGYWAYKHGRGAGMQTEKTRQIGLLQSAEEQSARILAESMARSLWPRGVHVAYVTIDAGKPRRVSWHSAHAAFAKP